MRLPAVLLLALALASPLASLGCSLPAGAAGRSLEAPAEEQAGFAVDSYDDTARGFPSSGFVVANPAPAAAPQVEQRPEQTVRHVIYSATVRLVVVDAAGTARSVQRFAEELGGHLQESDARSVTVRVPSKDFEGLLARIEQLGEVVDRNVRASDVTEQVIELEIRLDNAKRTRERLVEHLSASTKMEDTLKIEAELARVTAEIELIEGKLRFLRSQIAMSTIRVELNLPNRARPVDVLGLPFAWVENLGDGLLAGAVESRPRKPGLFSRGPRFDPPAGFLRYYHDTDEAEAMDGEGLRIKVQQHDNYDGGPLAFWTKLARRALVHNRSLAIVEERDLGDDRSLIHGEREVAGVRQGYLLVLARNKDDVYAFETWGPKEHFDARYEDLVKSAKSLQR